MMTETIAPHIRKAAILIKSLDGETAAALLTQLAPEEVQAVRVAIKSLGDIRQDEQADVMDELQRAGSPSISDETGVELDESMFCREPPEIKAEEQPFAFLESAEPETIVPYLLGEQAQTVAVILSCLEPARAARVLAAIPVERQTEIVRRLASLGPADRAAVKVIEEQLANWIEQQAKSTKTSGPIGEHAARILAASSETSRDDLLQSLRRMDNDAAEQLDRLLESNSSQDKNSEQITTPEQSVVEELQVQEPLQPALPSIPKPVVTFEQIHHLNASMFSDLLRRVDPNVLQLALVGAEENFVARFAERLPSQIARQFVKGLHLSGPTRLSDVGLAQQRVADAASEIVWQAKSASRN